MDWINEVVNQLNIKYPDARHTKEELIDFIKRLNFDIQYLGLTKVEMIKIISNLYRE